MNDPGSRNAQASTHEWMCFGEEERRGTNMGGQEKAAKQTREQKQMG